MPGFGLRDIEAVSIPFTVGVVAAAVLPFEGESYLWPALGSSVGLAALFLSLPLKGKCTVRIYLLYFLLGSLCYFRETICGPVRIGWRPESAMERLCSLIDSSGLEHGSSTALVKALLTGRKDGLGKDTVELFRASGASHILALSGLHLGVIYALLSKVLAILGNSKTARLARSVAVCSVAAFYVWLTGASASIVRAFIFICVNELASNCPERRKSALSAFSIALTLQLCFHPAVIESVGFQLSYLAMLGILTVYPRIEKWYPEGLRFDPMRKLWKSMALSVSCQLFTAPAVLWYFHSFPKYFIITNIVSLPLTEMLIVSSVLMLSGEAAGVCPDIIKSLCDFLAQTLLKCLEITASL